MACRCHNYFYVGQLFNISILQGDDMKIYQVTFAPVVQIVVREDGTLLTKSIDFDSSFTGDVEMCTELDDEMIPIYSFDEQDKAVDLADNILYTLDIEQRFVNP